MIIQSNSPFNIVKCSALKELLQVISGREVHMPTSTTIMSSLSLKFNEMKAKLKLELSQQSQVCLTTDIWTHSARSYLGVSVHYYDKIWNHKSYIIAFRYLKERHTYDYLARNLTDILQEFELSVDRISHIVTDGGSNFCKAFKIYGKKTDFSESLAAIECTNMVHVDDISDDEEDIVIINNSDPILVVQDNEEYEEDNNDNENNMYPDNIQGEQIELPEDGFDSEIVLPPQMRCFSHLLNLIGERNMNFSFKKISMSMIM